MLSNLKRELFIIRRAFFKRRMGWEYLYYRYVVAPRIYKLDTPIERPVQYPELAIHILVCARDLTMTLWSLKSFYENSGVVGPLYIHSDGSLTRAHITRIKRLLPNATIIYPEVFEESFKDRADIPASIVSFRMEQPVVFLKKLVDPNFTSPEPYIFVIDPDLIWNGLCTEVIEVLACKGRAAYMMAGSQSDVVHVLPGTTFPEELSYFNGGMIFYHRDRMDLERLGAFFDMLDMSKHQRFIGQSGHAYALMPESFPLETYVLHGALTDTTKVKHYTSPEREKFFTVGIPHLQHSHVRD